MLKFGEACFKAKHRWPSSTHYSSLVSPWTLKNTMFMITVFNGEDTLTSCPVTERLPLLAAALCTAPQELPPSRFRFLSTTLHTIISGLIKIIQMSVEKTVSCDGPLTSGDALFFFWVPWSLLGLDYVFDELQLCLILAHPEILPCDEAEDLLSWEGAMEPSSASQPLLTAVPRCLLFIKEFIHEFYLDLELSSCSPLCWPLTSHSTEVSVPTWLLFLWTWPTTELELPFLDTT